MNVKILGSGCARCKQLHAEAEKALARVGLDATVENVEQIDEIMRYGVMSTPALVIDGDVKCAGRVAAAQEIADWLTTAVAKSA